MEPVAGGGVVQMGRLSPLISPLNVERFGVWRPSLALTFPKWSCPTPCATNASLTCHAKKRDRYAQPVIREATIRDEEEEVEVEEAEGEVAVEVTDAIDEGLGVEEELTEDFEDDIIMEDDEDFEEEFKTEDTNLYAGDGGAGGGISLAGTWWDKEALSIAEEVSMTFNGDLKIYALKTSANLAIRLRIEKLSTRYGSPSMNDIEAFSTAYQLRLDEAVHAGRMPDNISLEVSSPGVERVVRVPDELERFKDKPMYVKYNTFDAATTSLKEIDGVFKLISFDMELCQCTWGIADVKINRQQAGKGRPLSKKQREWRLQTSFESLRLVRLYSDC